MFATELHTSDASNIFRRFVDVIEERHWTKRAKLIREEIRGNRLLGPWTHEEYEIVYALDSCSEAMRRYRIIPATLLADSHVYAALAFCAQTLSLLDLSPPDLQKSLMGRLRGAFRNADDLRALQLELHTATHFVRRGNTVLWPETQRTGRVDLFIPDVGPNGLQVECKSVSVDKGRKIHRREALEFWHRFDQGMSPILRGLSGGLCLRITLPDRLPKNHADRMALIAEIRSASLANSSKRLSDGTELRISKFDFDRHIKWDRHNKPIIERDDLERITGTQNGECMVRCNMRGAVVGSLQSAKDNSLLDALFETLKDAADRQLDQAVPGLLVTGFQGIDNKGLHGVASQDFALNQAPTALV
jgi:hypothetical protein